MTLSCSNHQKAEAESTGRLTGSWSFLGSWDVPNKPRSPRDGSTFVTQAQPSLWHCAPRLFGRGLHGIYQYIIVYQCVSATHLHNLARSSKTAHVRANIAGPTAMIGWFKHLEGPHPAGTPKDVIFWQEWAASWWWSTRCCSETSCLAERSRSWVTNVGFVILTCVCMHIDSYHRYVCDIVIYVYIYNYI